MATELATVDALRPATRGYNLIVKVLESKTVMSRARGGKADAVKVAECIVGDSTGTVILSAKNQQVDLAQPGTYLELKNAKVDMFRGSMKLVVDSYGTLEVAEGQSFVPRTDFNMSLIEFELVAFDGTA